MSVGPQRHQRISELFTEASRLPVAERRAYLERGCGGDVALIDEVLELLAHHDRPAVGMVTGALNVGALVDVRSAHPLIHQGHDPGSALASTGRFTIIRLLGEGGMGTVYLAEQERPRRTVALKVMRAGMAGAERLRKRFELEAEVLRRLEHPGIARIYDAGTAAITTSEGTATVPYFAMEYVDGMPLMEHIQTGRLGTRDRMRLLAKIAEAVGEAHRHGIVHRDIKPQNIIVDRQGNPKVLDFGVARATDSDIALTTIQTDVGQLIGTLGYMSPEQVAGDPTRINARTDVYALGALGYEMLTGKPLVDAHRRTMAEVARIIQDVEPPSLSSISRVYRGDLDTIVAKAIDKEPTRRYRDANELASDVSHYLNDEPIVARRATTMYQLAKFTRRNRVLVGGIVATIVVLVLGLVGTGVGFLQAMQDRDRAFAEQTKANTARELAELRFVELRKLAKSFIYDFHDMIADLPGSTEARKKLVSTALEYLDRLGAEQSNDTTLLMELSEGYLKVGQAQGYGSRANLGDREGAMKSFRKAETIRERMLELEPTDDAHLIGLGRVRNQIAMLELDSGHHQAALDMFSTVLAMREGVLAKAPDDRARQREVAISHQWMGNAYRALANEDSKTKDSAKSDEHLASALEHYRSLAEIFQNIADPSNPGSTRDLTVATEKIGDVYTELGRLDEALVEYRKSLAIRSRQFEEHPDNHEYRTDLVAANGKLGDRLMRQRKYDDAEPYLQRSFALATEAVNEDPADVLAKINLYVGVYRFGQLAESRATVEDLAIDSRRALYDEGLRQYETAQQILRDLDKAGKLDETRRDWMTQLDQGIVELKSKRERLDAPPATLPAPASAQ